MSQDKALLKLESLFKEEQWGRIEPKDVNISKFKTLDDLFNSFLSAGLMDEAVEYCREHIRKHEDSIVAAYLLGLFGYHSGKIEDLAELRKLVDVFIASQKWAVVEVLSEKILEYGEDSSVLRAFAVSLERLGRFREAIPVLENLLKINRFDTEVARKLAMALIDKSPEKSVYYMKLAIEGFIKKKEYDSVPELWAKLVQIAWQDTTFFERAERMLVDGKQQELAASLLKNLLNKYRETNNLDESIAILKKILLYKPDDTQMRRDLVKLYKDKYGSHSQFEQFLRLSKLNNFKVHIKFAIQDFENYIIFDVDNYAFHNSWKTGKIKSIDSENVVVNFRNKEEHQMSIKMALQSLAPIQSDHLYAMEYEDPDGLKKMFEDDFLDFFEILIKSYGNEIHLSDIKHEIVSRYIDEKNWAKWWSKARTQIRKSPIFGVSEKKKDIIFMREKPVTYVEELLDKFLGTGSFSAKLDVAVEFCNNIDSKGGATVAHFFVDYFIDETKGSSNTRLILSYLILNDLVRLFGQSKVNLEPIREKVVNFIKTADELPLVSMKIGSYDYKKDFVNLIEKAREDWPHIISEILFETPVRIHRYIFNMLLRARAYNEINNFIDRAITGARQFPDIFLWVAKSLFNRLWDYEWLDYSKGNLSIIFFRLMNDLKKIESEGSRLKNQALDIIFANDSQVMREIVKESDKSFLGRAYDIFSNLPYIEDSQSEKFLSIIKEKFPDFVLGQTASDMPEQLVETFIVTQNGYDRKKAELDNMTSVEMTQLSKELAKVSEVTGDPRENVEYNTLLEKQAILKMAISKLDEEIKKATILDPNKINTDSVSVGTKVSFVNNSTNELRVYTILGPWDADFEKKILSYRSPIAGAILNKKPGEEFILNVDDAEETFTIKSVEKAD